MQAACHSVLARRRLLELSAGSFLGLSLGGLWRAQAASRDRLPVESIRTIRSCVLVFYYGGPSHLDTYDQKPEAPIEVRGSFQSIQTSVPGLRICEHLPHMARVMDRVAVIRSVTHQARLHDSASIHALTGRPLEGPDRELFAPLPQFYPSFGSAVAWARGARAIDVPFASLPFTFRNVHDVPCQGAGLLGAAFDPFRIEGNAAAASYQVPALQREADLPTGRLNARRELLSQFGNPLAIADQTGALAREKAYRLLESDALRSALDLSRESSSTRERYGMIPSDVPEAEAGRQRLRGQNLLLARRLVEAGVPFVNVYDFKQQGQNWDAHADGEKQHRELLLPGADRGLAALIEDLEERGLLDTTLIVAMGEFGRTPQINGNAGRDHWPDCYTALMAGGGITGGAIYGASDRMGAYPARDPVTPADIAATIFSRFGIDPALEMHDPTGRPHRIAAGEPITALFS